MRFNYRQLLYIVVEVGFMKEAFSECKVSRQSKLQHVGVSNVRATSLFASFQENSKILGLLEKNEYFPTTC